MQPLIPQATKKRLFVMRSIEVRLYPKYTGWAVVRGGALSCPQRHIQELSHHVTTRHPSCLVTVLLLITRHAYAPQIHQIHIISVKCALVHSVGAAQESSGGDRG